MIIKHFLSYLQRKINVLKIDFAKMDQTHTFGFSQLLARPLRLKKMFSMMTKTTTRLT